MPGRALDGWRKPGRELAVRPPKRGHHGARPGSPSQGIGAPSTGNRGWNVVPHAPVRIETKAWIGRRAMILKGVTVGEGAIVAAGSVVTGSVDPWTVVAGVPARTIRHLNK